MVVMIGDCAEATLAVSDAELGDLRAGVTTRTSSLMPLIERPPIPAVLEMVRG